MILVQERKVSQLEELGWVMDDTEIETKKLLCGLPVKMRNLRRDLALVLANGSVRPMEYQPTLARREDFGRDGYVKTGADIKGSEHLRDTVIRIFGGFV